MKKNYFHNIQTLHFTGCTQPKFLIRLALFALIFGFFNPAKAQTVIFDNTTKTIDINGSYSGITTSEQAGQQFIVGGSATAIQSIRIPLAKGDIDASFTVSLFKDNGSNKLGNKVADLYSGSNSSFPLVSENLTWLTIDQTTAPTTMPYNLSIGKYWVVLTGSSDDSDQKTYWYFQSDNTIPNGSGASLLNFAEGLSVSTTIPFIMKITAGAGSTGFENAKTIALSMYPNPATESFTINTEAKTEVSIYDISGNLVLFQHAKGITNIDITTLKQGIYMVKINGLVGKLVKQ